MKGPNKGRSMKVPNVCRWASRKRSKEGWSMPVELQRKCRLIIVDLFPIFVGVLLLRLPTNDNRIIWWYTLGIPIPEFLLIIHTFHCHLQTHSNFVNDTLVVGVIIIDRHQWSIPDTKHTIHWHQALFLHISLLSTLYTQLHPYTFTSQFPYIQDLMFANPSFTNKVHNYIYVTYVIMITTHIHTCNHTHTHKSTSTHACSNICNTITCTHVFIHSHITSTHISIEAPTNFDIYYTIHTSM